MSYPPYTREPRCIKCGCDYCRTKWVKGSGVAISKLGTPYYSTPPDPGEEKMVRTCGECGYSWVERPLDQNPPDTGER